MMLDFTVTHVGLYRREERHSQVVGCPWLAMSLSGLVRSRVTSPEGRLLWEFDRRRGPYMAVMLPGMRIDFEYGRQRENWVVMLSGVPLRPSPDFSCAEANFGEWVPFPFCADIPPELAPGWRLEFEGMRECYGNPTPRNMLRLRLGVLNALRHMIGRDDGRTGVSPEERLKSLIDDDTAFSRDISELGAMCGLSTDHLRVLFQRRYQTNPLAYRRQKRNARAMDLVANSSLSVKEMSPLLGFRHVSHFCMDFQKSFGISPARAIKKYRHGGE